MLGFRSDSFPNVAQGHEATPERRGLLAVLGFGLRPREAGLETLRQAEEEEESRTEPAVDRPVQPASGGAETDQG